MGQIINFYKYALTNKNVISNAQEYIISDLIDKNLSGINKIKEIDGMDMESKIPGKIIPGMIYIFKYNSLKDFSKESPFSDIIPIILCSGLSEFEHIINGQKIKGVYIHGYNLNYLTDKERCVLLDFIQSQYNNFYENEIYKSVANNSVLLNQQFGNLIFDNKKFAKLVEDKLSIKINNYYRLYNILTVDNLRLIEYNNWKYIPLVNVKLTVEGLSISEIRKLLNSTK